MLKRVLAVVMMLALCSCGNTGPQEAESSSAVGQAETQQLTDVPTEEQTDLPTESPSEAPTEESTEDPNDEWDKLVLFDDYKLIYDVNDFKIYERGWGVSEGYLGVAVLVENNTPYNVLLTTKYASVDDFATDAKCSIVIPSGKKVNDDIYFTPKNLEKAMVNAIDAKKVEFVFYLGDNDQYKHLKEFDSDPVVIELEE